ncbi:MULTISPECIES: hypothetical protein [unclassified Nocardia]|uniref:hypothetical protein n=1 Tax=unclassified Nocardia TaxID=2637762 RepID=UPI001CE3C802|nr:MULTISPECIES: hypothetical protein [unclassified Nocardia]
MTGAVPPLGITEIDHELARRAAEIDRVTATLLELDKHPGLTLIRRFPPTGITEVRWQPVRAALELMWEDFGRMRAILDSATATRGVKHKLTDTERAELTRLLRGRPYEAARTPIPMAQRSLTGPSEQVLFVGLADTLDRMRETFPRIAEFLDAVDAVNTRVTTGLAPLQEQLDRVGGANERLRAVGDGIGELLSRSATDPLALTAAEIDDRIAELAARLRRESALLAELGALVSDWPAAVARTRADIEALRETNARAERARAEAGRTIRTGPLPSHPDESAGLAARLDEVAANTGAAAALLELRGRIAAATAVAERDRELAQGLLDRRAELRGRLDAYRAKAARLGIGEDRDILASNQIALGLLSRMPCDLAAVTRAVADFQQLIGEKTGRRP